VADSSPPAATDAVAQNVEAQTLNANPAFDAFNVTMLSQVTPQSFSTNATCTVSATNVCANDIWGYVSPGGREYAILGLYTGTGFVDVTDPVNPFVVGAISDSDSIWSDMRTYSHYAYNVNESDGGLQVIELANIDPPTRQVSLVRSVTQSGLSTAHTLAVNTDSGYLYLCGSNLAGGRLVALSLADPSNPVIAGQALQAGYVHAAQVVSYTSGPYAGREIAFCYSGSLGLRILDVTDKSNMFTMATLAYPSTYYCHQGWLTNDRRYVLINDELDEYYDPTINTTRTIVVNVENLSAPQYVTSFTNGQTSIDHNLMIRTYDSPTAGLRSFVFEANYTTGLRIYNVTDVTNASEIGYFDTYSFNNGMSFNGAWGVYALLPSGNILVADMQSGLFVLDPSAAVADPCQPAVAPLIEPDTTPRNRYLAVAPSNAGRQTALRVKLVDLPPPFESFESTYMWVDTPQDIVDTVNPVSTVKRSRLTCGPVHADWGSMGPILIADDEIVPGGVYEVQQISLGCDRGIEASFSAPASVAASAKWGDMVGVDASAPPEGDTNFIDVATVVDKFKQAAAAVRIDVADLQPGEPDGVIDFVDISLDLDAFKGYSYPFSGPVGCP
jgi:choice-of-anchor B domain-containing protein